MSSDISETAQHYYKNSLLLEADIEEEIQSLSEEIDRKQKTIQDVLNLPKKISYECMVPLSKVAFTPGRMVHTNEFSVEVDAKSGKRQWMSHVEAAEHLRGEIVRIEGDIDELKNYLKTRRNGKDVSGAAKLNTTSYDTSPMPQIKKASIPKNHPKVEDKQKDPNEEYVPFAEELTSSTGYLNKNSNDDDDDDDDDEDDWTNTSVSGGGEGFEIREYCDQDGNVLDGQIVDLSAELSHLQTEQQKASEEAKAKGGGETTKGMDSLLSDINDKLNVPNSEEPAALDQDAIFIRELAEIASSKKKKLNADKTSDESSNTNEDDSLDSLFADLEKKEAAARSSQAAASKGLLSSGQWKKGFFSSSAPKKAKKKTVVTPAATPSPGSSVICPGREDTDGSSTRPLNKVGKTKESSVDATTESNTILNKTISTTQQDHIDVSNDSGIVTGMANLSTSTGGQEKGSPVSEATSLPPPPAKKVSRFKQNRAASAAASSSSSSSVRASSLSSGKSVPFTGHVIEK